MRCARLFRPHPALACHLPHPGEGSSRRFVTVRYSADFSVRLRSSADFSVKSRSRTEKIGTAERSLPPGGEGGAPATDEGEIGERTHIMPTLPGKRTERSEGGDFEVPPRTPLGTPFRKSPKNPKASPQRAPKTHHVSQCTHFTGTLCGEVLGVLRTFSERRF